jgi:hypothetical protein
MIFQVASGTAETRIHRGINILSGPRLSSLWLPRNLSNHMDRQARTGDTVLAKGSKITGWCQTMPWWLVEER